MTVAVCWTTKAPDAFTTQGLLMSHQNRRPNSTLPVPPLPPHFGPPIGPELRPIPTHSCPPFRPQLVVDVEHNTWRATATATARRTSGIPGVWPRRRRRLRRRRLRPFRAREDLCRDPHVCRFRLPRPQGSRNHYPVVPLRPAPARSAQHSTWVAPQSSTNSPPTVASVSPDRGRPSTANCVLVDPDVDRVHPDVDEPPLSVPLTRSSGPIVQQMGHRARYEGRLIHACVRAVQPALVRRRRLPCFSSAIRGVEPKI